MMATALRLADQGALQRSLFVPWRQRASVLLRSNLRKPEPSTVIDKKLFKKRTIRMKRPSLSRSLSLARWFSASGNPGKVETGRKEESLSEEEKVLRSYQSAKEQEVESSKAGKRLLKEKFAFNEEQRAMVRAVAAKSLKEYLARYKFMTVVDEKLLNETIKNLLAINDFRSIDVQGELPAMLDATIDKIFTFKQPDLVLNIFELVLAQRVPINEESIYQLNAVLISWGPKLDYRQQLSVLSLVSPDQYDQYKKIFQNYEDLFIDFFALGYEKKNPAEKLYSIEMLKVFRKVNYERLGFIHNIEDLIFEHLVSLNTYNLTRLITYVTQTQDMDANRREKFLNLIDNEVIQRARFFNETEAIDVLFQLVKTGIGSHLARRLLLSKVGEGIRLLTKERKLSLIAVLESIADNYKEKLAVLTLLQDYVDSL
jgi:hypothetical protein